MTVNVTDGIWYDISSYPTRTESSLKVRMDMEIEHTIDVYDLAFSLNLSPVCWQQQCEILIQFLV